MSDAMSVDLLCKIYRKIRDKKGELTKKYEEELAGLEQQQNLVAAHLKDILSQLNVKSMKTEHGTVYIQPKTRYYAMDWAVFGDWVVKNNAVDLLEKRVAQGNMKQWLEDNPTNPPPGLQAESEITVVVRKN
jgi:hypothetical protein